MLPPHEKMESEVRCDAVRPFVSMTFVLITSLVIQVEASPAAVVVLKDPLPQWKVGNLVLCHDFLHRGDDVSWGSLPPSCNLISSTGLSGLISPLRAT